MDDQRPAPKGRLIPTGLPDHCPCCQKGFSLFSNYTTRTGRIGRHFHRLAIIGGPIGLILIAILTAVLNPHDSNHGKSIGFGMVIGILGPAFFFEGLALIWPKVRTLHCHACGWEKDFPWPRHTPAQKKSGP